MSQSELTVVARDLLAVKAMIAELEAEAEALTDQIKGAMVDAGSETMSGPGWAASWRNVTSSRLDTSALKKALPEIAQQFTKKTTTCRFVIQATV